MQINESKKKCDEWLVAGHGCLAFYPRRPGGSDALINLQPTTERDALMHSGLYLPV